MEDRSIHQSVIREVHVVPEMSSEIVKAEAEKKAKALMEKREMLDKIEKMRENKH